MAEKKIRLERRRNTPFTVNCPKTNKSWIWSGATANKIDAHSVPQETYDWLFMQTTTFTSGELVICDSKAITEFNESLLEEDVEVVNNNIHTREEIVDILNSNTNSMKAKLEKITEKSEKTFVINVAKEVELDSIAKRDFISKWSGYEVDFSNEG